MMRSETGKTQNKIGFMQGRLSEIINNRIQSFPKNNWKNEFQIAHDNQFKKIEWTIDSDSIRENPLIDPKFTFVINEIKLQNNVSIPSVTCDYFMENPPWSAKAETLKDVIKEIIVGMQKISANKLVIPLVDNSSITDDSKQTKLMNFFKDLDKHIIENNIRICFESDFNPQQLMEFIDRFPSQNYGINYDIGNSASMGYEPNEEIEAYGTRILNVHVKDRLLGGKTVALGEGIAKFEVVFSALSRIGYEGNYILQTARASDGNHLEALLRYRTMLLEWIKKYE
jgi:L-ribulose-5-phosphate 3-epimerase